MMHYFDRADRAATAGPSAAGSHASRSGTPEAVAADSGPPAHPASDADTPNASAALGAAGAVARDSYAADEYRVRQVPTASIVRDDVPAPSFAEAVTRLDAIERTISMRDTDTLDVGGIKRPDTLTNDFIGFDSTTTFGNSS